MEGIIERHCKGHNVSRLLSIYLAVKQFVEQSGATAIMEMVEKNAAIVQQLSKENMVIRWTDLINKCKSSRVIQQQRLSFAILMLVLFVDLCSSNLQSLVLSYRAEESYR